jgi:hypothetical protein
VSWVSRQSCMSVFAIFVAGLICGTSIRPVVADDTTAPAILPSPDSSGLSEVQSATAIPELPCYRVRRFDPYVAPDPRSCAPSLVEAVGSGLLPPFGWGWYGWGFPGWRWGNFGWGFGGWGGPWGASGSFPYPFGFNGSFWFPRGSSWPYPSLSNWVYGGPRFLTPLSLPVYPLYPFPYLYGPTPTAGEWAPHLGQYYW